MKTETMLHACFVGCIVVALAALTYTAITGRQLLPPTTVIIRYEDGDHE